jgi:rSAM/selenodomain-associated transferase 1
MNRDGRMPVCIFAKPPVPGQVKRRLSKSMGLEAGAELAYAFLQDSWAAFARVNWVRPILVTTERHESLGEFLQSAEIWFQGVGTLGERLERILSRALEVSDIALAVGGDTPGLPARLLEQARAALQTADAVLGPAEDGGFYLLGLRRCPRGLLQGIEWSSEDTHRQTRKRLENHGLSLAETERWFDIDVPEDLWRFHRLLKAGQVEAPATAQLLQKLAEKSPGKDR